MAEQSCLCVPNQYMCGRCTQKLHLKIWRNMSAKDKAYDRHFAPHESRALDEADVCCSCHISPPCSYCVGTYGEG